MVAFYLLEMSVVNPSLQTQFPTHKATLDIKGLQVATLQSGRHLWELIKVFLGKFTVTMSPTTGQEANLWASHLPTETAQSAAKEVATQQHVTGPYILEKHKNQPILCPNTCFNVTTLWEITNNVQPCYLYSHLLVRYLSRSTVGMTRVV